METAPPTIKLAELEEFERKRCGYFADDFCRSSLYWASLCETMQDNEGSTDQVLAYIAGKMETDRIYCASVYANADKVFGDKKGAAKLRHDKIRQEEQRAKIKGEKPPEIPDALVAGGAKRELRPANSTVNAVWEMAEMECRAARYRDMLCDELEEENMLGKVKTMRNETQKRLNELIFEGNACLLSLRNIDKQVGHAFLHLKEILGNQLGGQALHEDVWFLNTRYHTAVFHQKEAWLAVNKKLSEVFQKLKDLEVNRRAVLRDFMVGANEAIFETWSMLPKLCGTAADSAAAVQASGAAVDQVVNDRMAAGAEEKRISNSEKYELANTTNMPHADPLPSDDSFIDGLTAPLESILVRSIMMVERREGKTLGSKYYPGLMVLSWQGFIHFFDVPESSGLKKDVSPAAALQDISPTISLDDLLSNRKDLDEVLMFKSTYTLQLDAESTVDGPSSKKSQHKIEVKGKTAVKQLFGSGMKTVTFRTANEAEMNHALGNIKEAIQDVGGMAEGISSGRLSSGGRTSFGSIKSDISNKEPSTELEEAPAPAPSHAALPDKTPEETTPAPAEECGPAVDKEKASEDDIDTKGKEEPAAA